MNDIKCKKPLILDFMLNFITICFFVLVSPNNGGTGGIYDGTLFLSAYLYIKSIAYSVFGINGCIVYFNNTKRVNTFYLFWLLLGVLMLAFLLLFGHPINPPDDPRGWSLDTIRNYMFLLFFDCCIVFLYTIIRGLIASINKRIFGYVSLFTNIALISTFIYFFVI